MQNKITFDDVVSSLTENNFIPRERLVVSQPHPFQWFEDFTGQPVHAGYIGHALDSSLCEEFHNNPNNRELQLEIQSALTEMLCDIVKLQKRLACLDDYSRGRAEVYDHNEEA